MHPSPGTTLESRAASEKDHTDQDGINDGGGRREVSVKDEEEVQTRFYSGGISPGGSNEYIYRRREVRVGSKDKRRKSSELGLMLKCVSTINARQFIISKTFPTPTAVQKVTRDGVETVTDRVSSMRYVKATYLFL